MLRTNIGLSKIDDIGDLNSSILSGAGCREKSEVRKWRCPLFIRAEFSERAVSVAFLLSRSWKFLGQFYYSTQS